MEEQIAQDVVELAVKVITPQRLTLVALCAGASGLCFGVVIGHFVASRQMKTKYEKMLDEEIEKTKLHFANMKLDEEAREGVRKYNETEEKKSP